MSEKKVLIVDYDRKSLESLTKLITLHGLEVLTASDGQEAYQIFQDQKPDLVLMEAMLPKMHGFDLSQKIYEETKGSIPVVIVTGLYKGPQYKNEALRSFGAADYFEKPYNPDLLMESIMNLLHEEIEIGEDLPDPKTVLKMVVALNPKVALPPKKKKSS